MRSSVALKVPSKYDLAPIGGAYEVRSDVSVSLPHLPPIALELYGASPLPARGLETPGFCLSLRELCRVTMVVLAAIKNGFDVR